MHLPLFQMVPHIDCIRDRMHRSLPPRATNICGTRNHWRAFHVQTSPEEVGISSSYSRPSSSHSRPLVLMWVSNIHRFLLSTNYQQTAAVNKLPINSHCQQTINKLPLSTNYRQTQLSTNNKTKQNKKTTKRPLRGQQIQRRKYFNQLTIYCDCVL